MPWAWAMPIICFTGLTVPRVLETCVTDIRRVCSLIIPSSWSTCKGAAGIERQHAELHIADVGQQLPGHNVGVMLHLTDDDFIAIVTLAAPK